MNDDQEAYEQLGAFYLGRLHDPASGQTGRDDFLFDSRDLTTHGVIVGMTGSGKTGLAITMLEEAAMDRIPVIAIDPKGDLGNLLLTFPRLAAEDFLPWISTEAAHQKGQSPDAFAAAQAERWRQGLKAWGQDGQRIARLRQQADFAVYTPGSAAGRQVSVLRSFAAPSEAVLSGPDALRERIESTVTSLLGLLGIEADPIRSREHLLLSTILQHVWQQRRSLELSQLIEAIQRPPFSRVGVMELESFYPAKDRFELALQLNGMLASPGFQAWTQGDPLSIPTLLYTPQGRPRVSIFSIAHLGEQERMFFVAMLLTEILSWMRGQSGTSSLRALVYMDEIFGFFPPSANPPSKPPMLTLLKQARAYGVGMLLATQNPVDLDYKGLGNTGTWFIGRLQTERDKRRMMDALQGASAGAIAQSRGELERLISGLGQRVFLMHNVKDDAPTLFETRWAMSYLPGPMTLQQLRRLQDESPSSPDSAEGASAAAVAAAPPTPESVPSDSPPAAFDAAPAAGARPVLPAGIPEHFLLPRRQGTGLRYRPALGAFVEVAYRNARYGVDKTQSLHLITPLGVGPVALNWSRTMLVDVELDELETAAQDGALFESLPPDASQPRSYKGWGRDAQRWIQANVPVTLYESKSLKAVSHPGESEAEFRMRLADLRREARDAEIERIRKRYQPRLTTLRQRERRAVQAVEKRAATAQQDTLTAALRAGGGLLNAFLGRKSTVTQASTVIRSAGRVMQRRQEITHATETVAAVRSQLSQLEDEFKAELAKVELAASDEEPLGEIPIRPTLTAMSVRLVTLLWLPEDASGQPLWHPSSVR